MKKLIFSLFPIFIMPITAMQFPIHHLNAKLIDAAKVGNFDEIHRLLEAGASIDARDMEGETPLIKAARKKQTSTCKLLLELGADVNAQTITNYADIRLPALHQEAVLRRANTQPQNGPTALMEAAGTGAEQVCRLLLEHNANANIKTTANRTTALIRAIYHGNASICKLIASRGADMNVKGGSHETALISALIWRDVSEALIAHSRFYPYYSLQALKESQDRIRTILLCWKRVCPTLPRDLKRLILLSNPELQRDTLNCPLGMFKDLMLEMPPQAIAALIRHGALDEKETIEKLAQRKMAQLKPLMIEAFEHAKKDQIGWRIYARNKVCDILAPDALEQNFGKEIRANIKYCLDSNDQLIPEESNCSVENSASWFPTSLLSIVQKVASFF
jgi:hypothetical protein